jgi:hypothetical protein
LLVLAIAVPLLNILFKHVVAERMGTIILSVLVAHTAWHWMLERFDVLRQFPYPAITAAGVAAGLRWGIVVVVIAAIAWVLFLLMQRWMKPPTGDSARVRVNLTARPDA